MVKMKNGVFYQKKWEKMVFFLKNGLKKGDFDDIL